MNRFRGVPLFVALVATIPCPARAFEGSLKWRHVHASTEVATTVAGKSDPSALYGIDPAKLAADPGARAKDSLIQVKGDMLRADSDKGGGYVVLDTGKGMTWAVMPDRGQVLEISQADAEAAKVKQDEMRKKILDGMASLPPEQRKMLEGMKGMDALKGGTAEPPKFRDLGESATINGMKTTAWEVTAGSETSRGWVTIDRPDILESYRKLQKSQERMAKLAKPSARAALAEKGMPVRVISVSGGSVDIDELLEVKSEAVADSVFAIDPKLKRVSMKEMMSDAMKVVPPPK